MVSELFQAGGPALAIRLKPGNKGVFTVTVDGRVLWDKKVQGRSPHIGEVKDLKAQVANMLKSGAVIQTN
jgi:predicted Rdx family selenoprotein